MAGTAAPSDAPSSPGITAVLILAAGAGTRMRSTRPKMLHAIAGKPLVWHAVAAAAGLAPDTLVAVLGHGREQVEEFLAAAADLPTVITAVQDQQLGTGHATACGLAALTGPISGTVIVTNGDVPLLREETLAALAAGHHAAGNAVTVLTASVPDPTGYGRIVRRSDGTVSGIVEHKDADAGQLSITEINSGVFAFDGAALADALPRIGRSNAQGEQYLTDVVALAVADGHRVGTVLADDPMEIEGVNDRVQLAQLARELNNRIVRRHQLAGVTIHDPATSWIHADVSIGKDTEILPGTFLQAGTSIGTGASIGPDTTLIACTVGDGARVQRSQCEGAAIGARATVGPFAFLRPGADLGEGAHVGAHVEIKKSTIGAAAKVPHLSYIGDATIGAGTNIGAGTITANYDGVHKYPTSVGENAFVGTNSTLVAPVTVADGAYVAAGSAVTEEVPAGALGVARSRQYNSDGWVLRSRAGTSSDTSARAAGATDRAASATDANTEDSPG
ncbi:MAG: bifunctional UDP-N-acetylglucosamine diphosphorylase/glucosamine-1-phosphate N-acetyltransferase GlmU [Nakamurella sp.]